MIGKVLTNGSGTLLPNQEGSVGVKVKNILKHVFSKDSFSWLLWYFYNATHIDSLLSDSYYLKLQYRCYFGKKPNMVNPLTFNEKLLWMKLFNRRPEYTTMVDKYEVKKYVADIIGEQYISPTIGIWDDVDSIPFDELPDQFVLKCTQTYVI